MWLRFCWGLVEVLLEALLEAEVLLEDENLLEVVLI